MLSNLTNAVAFWCLLTIVVSFAAFFWWFTIMCCRRSKSKEGTPVGGPGHFMPTKFKELLWWPSHIFAVHSLLVCMIHFKLFQIGKRWSEYMWIPCLQFLWMNSFSILCGCFWICKISIHQRAHPNQASDKADASMAPKSTDGQKVGDPGLPWSFYINVSLKTWNITVYHW